MLTLYHQALIDMMESNDTSIKANLEADEKSSVIRELVESLAAAGAIAAADVQGIVSAIMKRE